MTMTGIAFFFLLAGLMVMPRTPIAVSPEDEEVPELSAAVDASLLPPG